MILHFECTLKVETVFPSPPDLILHQLREGSWRSACSASWHAVAKPGGWLIEWVSHRVQNGNWLLQGGVQGRLSEQSRGRNDRVRVRLTLLGRREYTHCKRRRCRLNNGLAIMLEDIPGYRPRPSNVGRISPDGLNVLGRGTNQITMRHSDVKWEIGHAGRWGRRKMRGRGDAGGCGGDKTSERGFGFTSVRW
jgi:hypothetical protein